ncbi:MAG: hypothetical protein KIT02_03135 [Devosia sp.]|uniref:hypothetical protein n=1 Tax=Devosia sp. TaxID=1871048 RepID=UPI0024CAC540|nr:hypothetical protein [Devosia sp.]UYO00235.1 MAG: hypothetical protein KIT02_03135 [Devosia sp.]
MRVPNAGKAERERLDQIRRLEKKLSYFQSIPASRRDDECADEGESTCRALLAELGAPGHEQPQPVGDGDVTLTSIDEFLDDLEKR